MKSNISWQLHVNQIETKTHKQTECKYMKLAMGGRSCVRALTYSHKNSKTSKKGFGLEYHLLLIRQYDTWSLNANRNDYLFSCNEHTHNKCALIVAVVVATSLVFVGSQQFKQQIYCFRKSSLASPFVFRRLYMLCRIFVIVLNWSCAV